LDVSSTFRVVASQLALAYVSGFEKRAHFAQNAKIWQFSTYRNFKTPRALGFRLGL